MSIVVVIFIFAGGREVSFDRGSLQLEYEVGEGPVPLHRVHSPRSESGIDADTYKTVDC